MKIYLGTDHAGFEIKEELKKYLQSLGYEVEDCGAHSLDPQDDYLDFIYPVAKKVSENKDSKGIVLGGSGQGECMVANKVKGVRAAIGYNEYGAEMSREHNDANVLCIGGRVLNAEKAKEIVRLWLGTAFSGDERHVRRIKKIEELEDKNFK